MPWNQWRLDAVLIPLVPVVYVQVRAADRGDLDFDQDIVRAKLRAGHLAHVRARSSLRFYYGKHGFRHSIPIIAWSDEGKLLILAKCHSTVIGPRLPKYIYRCNR